MQPKDILSAPDASRSMDGSGMPGIYKLGAYFANRAKNSYPGCWGGDPFGFYAVGQQVLWEQTRGKPS